MNEDRHIVENKGSMPFTVPKDYFDELPMRVQQQLSEKTSKLRVFNTIKLWKPVLISFSSVCTIVLLIFVGIRAENRRIASKNNTFIENEILYQNDDDFIYDMVAQEALKTPTDKEAAYNYLMQENIDEETILSAE
jgi:hypothetical protein